MRTGPRALLAVGVGVLAAGSGYWLAGDALVAVHLGILYAVLGWLVAGHYTDVPDGDTWQVNRWNGLLGALPVLVVMPLLNNQLGLSMSEGFALVALAVGLAYTTFLIGVVMVREEQSAAVTGTNPDTSGADGPG
jgi:hypothetical protein